MIRTYLNPDSTYTIADSPIPEPGPGEALVRMQLAGICGSDMQLYRQGHGLDFPLTIGHEGIGIIEAIGPGVPAERIGQPVVIEPNIPCGNCRECTRGLGRVCRNKRIIGVAEHGVFAEYIALPADFLHPLPANISELDAVTVEPMAVAFSALNRSMAHPGDTITVIGLGAIGMLLTHLALQLGFRVLAAERVVTKLERAMEMGATPIQGDKETITKQLDDAGVTAVFECAGTAAAASLAIDIAPRGASAVLLGLSQEPAAFVPKAIARKGISIIPSLIYDHPTDFKKTLELISASTIRPGFIAGTQYPLKQLAKAMETAVNGEEIKILIRI